MSFSKSSRDSYFSFESLLERIDSSGANDTMESIIQKIIDIYDLKNIAYIGFNLKARNPEPVVKTTYSPEWIERYREKHYERIDPALGMGLSNVIPIDWASFDRQDPQIRKFFNEANEYGVGNRGLSVSVRGQGGDIGFVSFTADMDAPDWASFKNHYMSDLHTLSAYLHRKALIELGEFREQVPLTERECECLYWAGCGKTAEETALILGISHRVVRFHTQNILTKLNAVNMTHAVAKAIATEIINIPC